MSNIIFNHLHSQLLSRHSAGNLSYEGSSIKLRTTNSSPNHTAFPTLLKIFEKTGNPIPPATSLDAVDRLANLLTSDLKGSLTGVGSNILPTTNNYIETINASKKPENFIISSTTEHEKFGAITFYLPFQLSASPTPPETLEDQTSTNKESQETSVQALADLIGGIEIDEDIDFHDLSTWVMNVNNGMMIKKDS